MQMQRADGEALLAQHKRAAMRAMTEVRAECVVSGLAWRCLSCTAKGSSHKLRSPFLFTRHAPEALDLMGCTAMLLLMSTVPEHPASVWHV